MSFLNGTAPGLRQTRTPTTQEFTGSGQSSVTLSSDPGSEDNVIITFDGVTQHRSTYSVSGTTVSFSSAVPTGVAKIEATFTVTHPTKVPADNSVTTAKIGDDQVTEAKIAPDAIGLTELKAGIDGELITWDASGNPAAVAVGTATHVLTSNGAGAPPTFQAAAGGGWEFVSAQTASSSANIDFTGLASGYDYQLYGYGVLPATDATYLEYEYGTSTGPTYQTSGYDWGTDGGWGSGGFTFQGHAEQNGGDMEFGSRNQGSAAGEFCVFEWTVLNPADSGSFTYSLAQVGHKDSGGNNVVMTAAGWRDTNEAVTALRVHYTSGNISVGYFKLFKRANA